MLRWVPLCLALAAPPLLAARVVPATPQNYRRKLPRLQPGDVLLLGGGVYRDGLPLVGLHGRPGAPIVIAGGGRAQFHARRGANTVELSGSSHLVLRGLVLDGKGLPVDAIKAKGPDPSHHVTIEDCTIRGHGANQQTVGISTKAPAWDWVIRRNRITGAGTGLYLGDSSGDQPFIRGTIEYNLVLYPLGYCLQIKRQNERSRAPGIPAVPCTTVIRYNVLVKRDGGDASQARPNLLVGGFPERGPGAEDRYAIYGNVLWRNEREPLFQGTGRLSLHDNLLVGGATAAIRIAPHHGRPPRRVRVYHNTIYRARAGIELRGLAAGGTALVFGNLLVAAGVPGALDRTASERLLRDARLEPGRLDLQPRELPRCEQAAALRARVADDLDHGLDFLGRSKPGFDHCGAFCTPAGRSHPLRHAPLRERRR